MLCIMHYTRRPYSESKKKYTVSKVSWRLELFVLASQTAPLFICTEKREHHKDFYIGKLSCVFDLTEKLALEVE